MLVVVVGPKATNLPTHRLKAHPHLDQGHLQVMMPQFLARVLKIAVCWEHGCLQNLLVSVKPILLTQVLRPMSSQPCILKEFGESTTVQIPHLNTSTFEAIKIIFNRLTKNKKVKENTS
jgi:hypothetical protein